MLIQDNGRRFNSAVVLVGTGLKSMQQRMDDIGGSFRIDTVKDGTRISLDYDVRL